jgi:dihydrodipicolinate synthase/N-acetylneuraminate lyase
LPPAITAQLHKGQVIPAHPLALDKSHKLDERRQRALTRYYLDAGAGGIAVAVHTTQFEIRRPDVGLLRPVLELAREEIDGYASSHDKPIIKIAGVLGRTDQAVAEARIAADLGYHAGLLSLSAFQTDPNEMLLEHATEISQILPLVGFYLQPAVGGRILDYAFWRDFCQIENVAAIKIAPFNRYQTVDVIRGTIASGRADSIALYTGNDDNIVADLLTEFELSADGRTAKKRIVGGLLGHWAVWTRSAVKLLERVHTATSDQAVAELTSIGVRVTDSNAAFFDAAHDFKGCIVGIHEVLRRQGLLEGIWTLNPDEGISEEQQTEIDRVYDAYPELNDDSFVRENLNRWLR